MSTASSMAGEDSIRKFSADGCFEVQVGKKITAYPPQHQKTLRAIEKLKTKGPGCLGEADLSQICPSAYNEKRPLWGQTQKHSFLRPSKTEPSVYLADQSVDRVRKNEVKHNGKGLSFILGRTSEGDLHSCKLCRKRVSKSSASTVSSKSQKDDASHVQPTQAYATHDPDALNEKGSTPPKEFLQPEASATSSPAADLANLNVSDRLNRSQVNTSGRTASRPERYSSTRAVKGARRSAPKKLSAIEETAEKVEEHGESWSMGEDMIMLKDYDHNNAYHSIKEIAKRLGKSQTSVKSRVFDLNEMYPMVGGKLVKACCSGNSNSRASGGDASESQGNANNGWGTDVSKGDQNNAGSSSDAVGWGNNDSGGNAGWGSWGNNGSSDKKEDKKDEKTEEKKKTYIFGNVETKSVNTITGKKKPEHVAKKSDTKSVFGGFSFSFGNSDDKKDEEKKDEPEKEDNKGSAITWSFSPEGKKEGADDDKKQDSKAESQEGKSSQKPTDGEKKPKKRATLFVVNADKEKADEKKSDVATSTSGARRSSGGLGAWVSSWIPQAVLEDESDGKSEGRKEEVDDQHFRVPGWCPAESVDGDAGGFAW